MTRVLSELLGAKEPWFSHSLRELEKLSGHRAADIKLTSELGLAMQAKLALLGLDHSDTTGEELYLTLGSRLKIDEQHLMRALGLSGTATGEMPAILARALKGQIVQLGTYAMKPAAAKRLLKANLPRRTMRALGYRSAESMFKQESPANIYAAALLAESTGWSKKLAGSYGRLKAADFEPRDIAVEHPSSTRWEQFAETVVAARKRHVLPVKELGAVVIMPLPAAHPALITLTTAVLSIRAINEVRAAGTYLKLHHMQPQFGAKVSLVAQGEPVVPAAGAGLPHGRPLSWHSVHQFFGRMSTEMRTDVLEPLVSAEDLAWDSAERVLARLEPSLAFWQGTEFLGHAYNGGPVGLNLTDALISHANQLGYGNRILSHFRQSLEAELMLRYLNHDKLEQMITGMTQKRLAPSPALAYSNN